ncbi:predicted protein [Nematostella vectensis]|uniref:G-protein coupled receptors family 1 profile domain-containing protein n=1 Tax=Nematostella vectensis TaxID=45351 RepID=A7SKI1_NEMVE|nr:neuromedin-K receptor [Nematostella vectensis]EDO35760.1 predicted protein [Nematostella vectensis]|eukprot:XP_001627823.1 predicted protein [Nematostella vectensis]
MNLTTVTPSTTTPTVTPSDRQYFLSKVISYAAVSVLIIAGNLLCLVVFLRTPQMRRKRAYYLLISLSIADALVGISLVEKIALEVQTPSYNINTNQLGSLLYYLASPCSLYNLAAISVERFIVTVFPIYHRTTGMGMYLALVGVPWLMGVTVLLLFILAYKVAVIPHEVVTYSRITIVISLLIIIIAYTALALKLKYAELKINSSNPQAQVLRDRKLAFTLIIVTLFSLITWAPYGVYITVLAYCRDCKSRPYARELYLALNLLRYLNSGINVIIYMVRMPEFKRDVVRILPASSSASRSRQAVLGTGDTSM